MPSLYVWTFFLHEWHSYVNRIFIHHSDEYEQTKIRTDKRSSGINCNCPSVSSRSSFLIRLEQKHLFKHDYKNLERNLNLDRKSKILTLRPYLDNHPLIRINRRILHQAKDNQKRNQLYRTLLHHEILMTRISITIDTMSGKIYITKRLFKQLQLPIENRSAPLHVKSIGGKYDISNIRVAHWRLYQKI